MRYLDGFVIPVRTDRKEEYERMAANLAIVLKEYGALRVCDSWGDDIQDGGATDFPRAVKVEPGETIVFSWILWPSKQVRNEANARMAGDPRMQIPHDAPFDVKRMIVGGFTVVMDSDAPPPGWNM